MKKIKNFKIKTYSSNTGKLVPIYFNKKFPMKIKRIFFLYGKKNKIGGNHAHKKCSKLFFLIFGTVVLYIKTTKIKKKIVLNHTSKTGVLVPPKYWCSIKFIKNNSILMVACDKYYNVNDYLESFKEYKKYLKRL